MSEETISVDEVTGRIQYLTSRLQNEINQQVVLAGQLNDAYARIAAFEKAEADE